MIKDSIKNANLYYGLSRLIEAGLKYIIDTDFELLENGRYEIINDDVYAVVQDYYSKPIDNGKFEAHKKYIDIQYIIHGKEKMGASHISNFDETTHYDQEKDIVFLKPKTATPPEFVEVKENDFIIFTPEDAHMPSIALDKPEHIKKVVIKVRA